MALLWTPSTRNDANFSDMVAWGLPLQLLLQCLRLMPLGNRQLRQRRSASSTFVATAQLAMARPSIRPPSTRPLRPPLRLAEVLSTSRPEPGSPSPSVSRAMSRSSLAQGAILAAASPLPGQTTGYNGGTYDAAEPNTAWDAYQDYGHNHWKNSLLWGIDIQDVSITGPGLIYGKGLSLGVGPGRPPDQAQNNAASDPSVHRMRCESYRALLAATTPCTRPSNPALATRPSRSRTAATLSSATSPFSRADTSACCSPASTT